MTLAGGLSLQAVGFNGKGMASLPASSCSHSLAGIRGRKANTGRGDNCQGSTFGCASILKAQALALDMSTQKTELVVLTCALKLAAEKPDSKMLLPLFMYTGIYIYIYI
jgi:hypothetical protein